MAGFEAGFASFTVTSVGAGASVLPPFKDEGALFGSMTGFEAGFVSFTVTSTGAGLSVALSFIDEGGCVVSSPIGRLSTVFGPVAGVSATLHVAQNRIENKITLLYII